MDISKVPLMTVGIVVLNREWIIAEMLKSLIGQSYPHNRIYIVVVDGGSKDRTVDIVRKTLDNSDLKGYEIISQVCNIPEGRNICIKKMLGDMLFFWDSDVLMEKDALQRFVGTALREKVDIVSAKATYVSVNSADEIDSKLNRFLSQKQDSVLIEALFVGMGHTLISRKVFESVLFDPDLTFSEDQYFSVLARKRNFKMVVDLGVRVFDINIMREVYSDIYVNMPLTSSLRGLRKKAKSHVLSYTLKPTIKGVISYFLKYKRYIIYLGYLPAACLTFLGLFGNIYLLMVFPMYFFVFAFLQVVKRGINQGLRSVLKSMMVGIPFSLLLVYYFIVYAMKD